MTLAFRSKALALGGPTSDPFVGLPPLSVPCPGRAFVSGADAERRGRREAI
jgi:hypothetical protein